MAALDGSVILSRRGACPERIFQLATDGDLVRNLTSWKARSFARSQSKKQPRSPRAPPLTPSLKMRQSQSLCKKTFASCDELGIGGWQPHPANEVFAHRYGKTAKTKPHSWDPCCTRWGFNLFTSSLIRNVEHHSAETGHTLAIESRHHCGRLPEGANNGSPDCHRPASPAGKNFILRSHE